MASSDFVPWNIYERDIKRLSDDIDRLVNKIDGLVESIASLTISQHRDEFIEESRRESHQKKWALYLAGFSTVLSLVSAVALAIISKNFL
jgi:enoyl-[acyl-carrier-protein] reductase (NADH)